MKACILMGSFREEGNTATLTQTVINEFENLNIDVEYITITDKNIEPCTACWTCQDIFEGPGCPKKDDANDIFESVLDADCIIFATPIYSWYCTPPMKALMDRLVYTMNKYYGKSVGPCLWEGKRSAIITTCGYDIEHGAGVFEEGVKRYSQHSNLNYVGKIALRDIDGIETFRDKNAISLAKEFVSKIVASNDRDGDSLEII